MFSKKETKRKEIFFLKFYSTMQKCLFFLKEGEILHTESGAINNINTIVFYYPPNIKRYQV